ncbi:unnamed protein product [Agarophyton chilense]
MSAHNLSSVCTNSAAAFFSERVHAASGTGATHAFDSACVLAPLTGAVALPVVNASSVRPRLTLSDCSELSSATSRDDNRMASLNGCDTRRKGYDMKRRSRCGRTVGNATGKPRRIGAVEMKSGGKKVRSSKNNIPGESRYWTASEHKLFIEAVWKYGPKNLKAISAHVGTRNMIQCRTHEQKCFMRLMREAQRENMARNGIDIDGMVDENGKKLKAAKDVYSVSPQCGLLLLCTVSEEMSRSG